MPRKGIVCSMCGGEFFEHSFPIHQKACAAKQQHIRLQCQHCSKEVPKLELEQHLARCPKAKKLQARPQLRSAPFGPISNVFDSLGRLQCAVCGRWFSADRVAKHQGICSYLARRQRTVFDSFKQRRFDPLVHRAAIAPARRFHSTSGATTPASLAAARSYYSFAPTGQHRRPAPRTSGVTASRSSFAGSRGVSKGVRGGSSSSLPSQPSSSRHGSDIPQRPVNASSHRPSETGIFLHPPASSTASIGPVTAPRNQSFSPGRGQASSSRGPPGPKPPTPMPSSSSVVHAGPQRPPKPGMPLRPPASLASTASIGSVTPPRSQSLSPSSSQRSRVRGPPGPRPPMTVPVAPTVGNAPPQRPLRTGMPVRPPPPYASTAAVCWTIPLRGQTPSPVMGQGPPFRGPPGPNISLPPLPNIGRPTGSSGGGIPVTSSRGGLGQLDTSSRFQGRGRDAPPSRFGRGSPGGAGGGGGLSTSNVCSPDNPPTYPNYPT